MDNSRNNWRKTKEGNSYHYIQKGVGSKPRSQNNTNSSFDWQSSSWEKKFCVASGVPWKKVLETKKYMYIDQDQKVLEWNDSAVEEAYWNAKTRFWAKMHGQPCDIKLPDPDDYIDKINWDSDNVDPQLILDLDKEEPEAPNKDGGVVLGIPVVPEQYLCTPNGWGDVEEGEVLQQHKDCEKLEVMNNWEDSYVYVPQNRNDACSKNLNSGKSNMSRYKISRFDNNGNCGPSFVDEYGVKRGNFGYERPLISWRPVSKRW